jgi:hypothetical protein
LETTKVLKFPKNLVIPKKNSTFARFLSKQKIQHHYRLYDRHKRQYIEGSY